MKTQCPECNNSFTASEALCVDWKDPGKSFGCPHCGTFYEKNLRPSSQHLITAIFTGGISVPAFFMAASYFKNGDIELLIYGCIILASCLAIGVIHINAVSKASLPLKRVNPWQVRDCDKC